MPAELIFKNDICEWIDIEAPNQEDLDFVHQKYNINMLLLDDILEANHLPKYEEDHDIKFYLMRESTDMERSHLNSISDISTKLGLYIVGNTIITIHRLKNRSVYEYRKEIDATKEVTVDKIALALAIKVLLSYDEVSDVLIEKIDTVEKEIFLKNHNTSAQIQRLYRIKRRTGLNARVLNLSDAWVSKFKKLNLSESEITDLEDKYKDVQTDFEHLTVQVGSLISMFLALSDQKANQVMKILAMYSVYFLPLTFIAGLYGMNFKYMPELAQPYGYYTTLAVMAIIVIVIFIYFKKKKW